MRCRLLIKGRTNFSSSTFVQGCSTWSASSMEYRPMCICSRLGQSNFSAQSTSATCNHCSRSARLASQAPSSTSHRISSSCLRPSRTMSSYISSPWCRATTRICLRTRIPSSRESWDSTRSRWWEMAKRSASTSWSWLMFLILRARYKLSMT